MSKMSEDELRALTDSEMRQSIGYWGGKLAEQRRKAEYYYLGLAKGDLAPPEIEGRSAVVSPDVRNTIESMLPQLMVKFTGGDSVVELEATKQEDEEKAKLATEYLNYLFYKKNPGHRIAYTWFKDALLQKVGVIKVWWDTREEETREEYKALNDIELAEIMDDEEVEIIDQKSYPDEEDAEHRNNAIQQLTEQLKQPAQALQQAQMMAQQNPQVLQSPQFQQANQAVQQIKQQLDQIQQTPEKMLYDVAFKRTKEGGKITIDNVPPEEFLISRRAKDIQSATFCGHRVARTKSELRTMGYPKAKIDNISSDDSAAIINAERVERLSWDDEQAYLNIENSTSDESQQVVWLTECYIRCDWDGDGISELRKVVRAGNEILENEEVDIAPFVSICPIPLPHKFFGLSVADLGEEPQKIKTNILRAVLDNMYLQVNGRHFAVEGQCNLDDLLTSRPGGVVRVKQPGAVGRLDQGMGDTALATNTLTYMEDFLENSTGWSRYSQGNDSTALNQTATGVSIITNRADMRLDLIARHFAEGFEQLFKHMLKLVTQNANKEDMAKLSGGWQPIDPREWRNQFDISINVGLGTGDKSQQANHMMQLMAVQEKMFQAGIVTPENLFNAGEELSKNLGYKNGDKFFTNPKNMPPKPQPPDPEIMKIQAGTEANKNELQLKAHLETQKMQGDMQLAKYTQDVQAQQVAQQNALQAQVEHLKAQNALQLAQAQAELERGKEDQRIQFEAWKAELEANTKVLIAQIGAEKQDATDPNEASEKQQTSTALALALQGFQEALGQMGRPRQIIRDANGKAQGIM